MDLKERDLAAPLEEARSWWWRSRRGERQKRPDTERHGTLQSLLFSIKVCRRGCRRLGRQHEPFPRRWIGRGGGNGKLQIPLLVGNGVTAQQPLVNVTCQHIGMAEEVSGQDGALFWNQWFCGLEFWSTCSLLELPDGFIYNSFTRCVCFHCVIPCGIVKLHPSLARYLLVIYLFTFVHYCRNHVLK